MKLKAWCFFVGAILIVKISIAQNYTQQITAIQYYYDIDPGVGNIGNGAIVNTLNAASITQTLQFIVPNLSHGIHNLYIRSRDEYGKWSLSERKSLLVESISISTTSKISAFQYFFDTDPGVGNTGNGNIVPITPTNSFNQTVALQVPNLTTGIHYIFIRSMDEYGRWSTTERRSLLIDRIEDINSSTITAYQYFFDVDPGIAISGNGEIVPIIGNSNTHALALNLPALAPGLHNLYMRVRDDKGKWSIVERRAILVEALDTSIHKITAYQYYFDNDPGYLNLGNGQIVTINPSDTFNQTIQIMIPTLQDGMHYLYLRAKDDQGYWSIVERKLILVDKIISSHTSQIVSYAYFFDHDSNFYVNNISSEIPITPSMSFNQPVVINIPNLDEGFHELYFKAKDDKGKWSITERRSIFINTIPKTDSIIAYQYYFDNDPGLEVNGNGAYVTISPTTNFDQTIAIMVPPLNEGIHYLNIRAKNASGRWSFIESKLILIDEITSSHSSQIVSYAYYFDHDSNFYVNNMSSEIPITPSMSLNQSVVINIPNLDEGFHELYFKAKDDKGKWSIAERRSIFINTIPKADSIIAYQYYFDNDPGLEVIGNGAYVTISPTSNFNQTIVIMVPQLTEGIHYLNIRAKNASGRWSFKESKLILVDALNLTGADSIIALQYFFDSDPGYGIPGNGQIIQLNSTTTFNQTVLVEIPMLTDGFHDLYIRAQNLKGHWGLVEDRPIFIETMSSDQEEKVVAIQYYFDFDPGIGISGVGSEIITLSPTDSINQVVAIQVPNLQEGIHHLFIRSKNYKGDWSIAERRNMLVDVVHFSHTELITAYQYYFDTDPGLGIAGNGNIVSITPTNNFDQTLNLIIPELSPGIHHVYIRARDSKGKWSAIERKLILVENQSLAVSNQFVLYQYYFDIDPGIGIPGNGAIVPINTNNTFNQIIQMQTPSLNIGVHYVYLRAKDQNGRWSLIDRDTLFITNDTLNLKLFIQGYYVGNGYMRPVLYNQGVEFNSLSEDVDSITIEFRASASPNNIVASVNAVLKTNGSILSLVPAFLEGSSCYIVIKNRNSIETWSALPVFLSSNTIYDFTTSAAKAFGANQVEVDNAFYAMYSGDLNQDDNIDLSDFSLLELDINNFEFGYKASDINGDGSVDLQDVPLLELNSSLFYFFESSVEGFEKQNILLMRDRL